MGGDVNIHVGDVKGGKPQDMTIRDDCEVIDEVGRVGDFESVRKGGGVFRVT
jgi:hypothetical protein